MKNRVVEFNSDEIHEQAEKYFIKNCGFDFDKEKHRRMMEAGLLTRSQGLDGISIRALISSYGPEVYYDSKIIIDGAEFKCQAFEQILKENVLKVYPYIITAGEIIYSDEDNILTQLYSYIWGSSYTDVGRDLLEAYLKLDAENEYPKTMRETVFLSKSFGPGFYGMETDQTKELGKVLEIKKLNIEIKESGIMIPLKTCAGIYILLNSQECMPHPDCSTCIGSPKGCAFCSVKIGERS
jgi:predicted sugar kinase